MRRQQWKIGLGVLAVASMALATGCDNQSGGSPTVPTGAATDAPLLARGGNGGGHGGGGNGDGGGGGGHVSAYAQVTGDVLQLLPPIAMSGKGTLKGYGSVTFGTLPDGTDPAHPDYECPPQHQALSNTTVTGTVQIDLGSTSARVKMDRGVISGGPLSGQTTDFNLSWDGVASEIDGPYENPSRLTIINPWMYVINSLGSGACLDSLTGRSFTVYVCTASDCSS